jgi:predicted aspartyl protease
VGTFLHPIRLIASSGVSETLDALVDIGSTFTTVPRPVLERLGVVPFARVRLRLANGRTSDEDIGEVMAEIDGLHRRTVICVFGEPDVPPLVGAQTLETFLVGVDPDQRRLVPLEAWWA